jgi:hypothetical protein
MVQLLDDVVPVFAVVVVAAALSLGKLLPPRE